MQHEHICVELQVSLTCRSQPASDISFLFVDGYRHVNVSRKEKGKTGLITKRNRNPQAKLKTLNKELFQGPELRRARLAAAQTAATSCLEITETGNLPCEDKS